MVGPNRAGAAERQVEGDSLPGSLGRGVATATAVPMFSVCPQFYQTAPPVRYGCLPRRATAGLIKHPLLILFRLAPCPRRVSERADVSAWRGVDRLAVQQFADGKNLNMRVLGSPGRFIESGVAASLRIGAVGSSIVISSPIAAFSRSTTPRKSLTCAGPVLPAFTEIMTCLVLPASASSWKKIRPSIPRSAPFFCSTGRALTSPSAHHWN